MAGSLILPVANTGSVETSLIPAASGTVYPSGRCIVPPTRYRL